MDRFPLLQASAFLALRPFFKHEVQEPVPDQPVQFPSFKSRLHSDTGDSARKQSEDKQTEDKRPEDTLNKPVRHSRAHRAPSNDALMMHLTIDAENVSRLRRVAMTCGEALSSMRVQPIPKTKRLNVWLCLSAGSVEQIMQKIMQTLPCAQFGRFKKEAPSTSGDPVRRSFNRECRVMDEASWPTD
jgi:hypothetical protein